MHGDLFPIKPIWHMVQCHACPNLIHRQCDEWWHFYIYHTAQCAMYLSCFAMYVPCGQCEVLWPVCTEAYLIHGPMCCIVTFFNLTLIWCMAKCDVWLNVTCGPIWCVVTFSHLSLFDAWPNLTTRLSPLSTHSQFTWKVVEDHSSVQKGHPCSRFSHAENTFNIFGR